MLTFSKLLPNLIGICWEGNAHEIEIGVNKSPQSLVVFNYSGNRLMSNSAKCEQEPKVPAALMGLCVLVTPATVTFRIL